MSHSHPTITEWLIERGMSEYAELFAKQKIDLAILPQLTEQDLKELGVALGDRRKILGWIEDLRGGGAHLVATPNGEDRSAERRHVTVLYCDLVDSTALSRQLDPEDMRHIIRAYQNAVTGIVRTCDGFVGGFRGDGVLIYFGYPRAHEDDVERAVRAATEIIAAVGAIEAPVPLGTRAGIATGLVVVGDLIGSDDTQERNMVGDTPNLAARLLALAKPDSVVISDETRKLLGGFFELEDLGLRHVKGIEQPVRSWAVMNPRAVESRFEALHASALTEFAGRDDELQLLLKRWRKAKTGEGQVVLISGEPGIGKSRLTAAVMEEIANEPHARLRYFCSPQHTDSAFYPIIGQMERAAGFAHEDSPSRKLEKLDALLTSIAATAHDKALIADLLSLPMNRFPNLDYDATQRRAKTLEALIAQVVSLAKCGPALMILEDAHWIDPSTLESLGRMVERLKDSPILYLITYRPEFNAPWLGESNVTALHLNRLDDTDAARIVTNLAGNRVPSATVIADIVERSDGIPLFIEEMTKAVLEAESEVAAKRTLEVAPSHKSAVPATLQASLMARLDRLGTAKGIAQTGAAIGRTFSHELIAAVARASETELAQSLDRLVVSGLLYRQGQAAQATYLFKHALVQDAAYSMLLREPRRALHGRILEALEAKFPEVAQNQPELLAQHATEAGQIEKAAQLWGDAGLVSFGRSAFVEAATQLSRAQDLISAFPSTTALRQRQIELQMPLSQAVMQIRGYSAPETESEIRKNIALIEYAESLGEPPSNPMLLLASFWILWAVKLCAYTPKEERALAIRCLALADSLNDALPVILGNCIMGISKFYAGELTDARNHFDEAIRLYKPEQHRQHANALNQDLRVYAKSYRCWTLSKLGYLDSAFEDVDATLSEAREIGHSGTLLFALQAAAWNHIIYGDPGTAQTHVDELDVITTEKHIAFWKAGVIVMRGQVCGLTDRFEDAIALLNSGIDAWRSTGASISLGSFHGYLAHAYAGQERWQDAWSAMYAALEIIENGGDLVYLPSVLDAAGEISLLQQGPNGVSAEDYFRRGVEEAHRQGAKTWELRAALHLAQLWLDQGKSREAYDLLAPIYNWFTEGFVRPDLKQAKALIDELEAKLH